MKKLAVCALIISPCAEILLGKRVADNLLCLPGGKVEEGETLVEALTREVYEETKLIIKTDYVLYVAEDDEYVCIYYLSHSRQDPKNPEPDKFVSWRWYKLDEVPKVCYKFTKEVIARYVDTFLLRD